MPRAVPASFALFVVALLPAQEPPANGPRRVDPGWIAWTGGTVIQKPGVRLERATLVARDGRIVSLDTAPPPAGATIVDCQGLTLYAGLVDPFVVVDVPALEPVAGDAHWHPMVMPQRRALDGAGVAEAERAALRRLGYTAVGIAPAGGIVKGTGAVVLLDEPSETSRPRVVRDGGFAVASLQTGRGSHPGSEMGAISVLRQSLADGEWYRRCVATTLAQPGLLGAVPPGSHSLAALAAQHDLPLWFDVRDELQALRVQHVAREFERSAVVVGSGMEFRRLAALTDLGAPIVVPLQFPEAPDVATLDAAERTALRQLQSWEQAPTNAARLAKAGLRIAFTTVRNSDRSTARTNLERVIACGLTPAEALAALTTTPAELLGVADQLGALEPGKLANVVAVAGDLFDAKAPIRAVWVGGVQHLVEAAADAGLDGSWSWQSGWPEKAPATPPVVAIDGKKLTVELAGEGDQKVRIEAKDVQRQPTTLTARLQHDAFGPGGAIWLRCHLEDGALVGLATRTDGSTFVLRGLRTQPAATTEPDGGRADGKDGKEPRRYQPPELGPLPTPLGGFTTGYPDRPEDVLIRGGTVWPCDGRAPIVDGAVLLRDGKIAFVGPSTDLGPLPVGVTVVDAVGKHVTPGLIDCHSHTGISRGVNEGGQAVTAEVRIQDVIDPDDVNWYRQLAGGVTAVHQLHGSANAIGGQSAVVKIRYGVADPAAMLVTDAAPGMKWALGENPRGANGSGGTRYPSTRMGVEALIRDRLAAAEAYAATHRRHQALAPAARARELPPRRDLELEAIAEILAGTRRIHCHSYRQDEIFMLCTIAQEYGIRIGTFQHVLEGYKVADAIAAHAIGASSFADWWGYKLEVQDAIPDNPAILFEVGANVSINSDSDEHARRLNTEAGKAVKYGGVPAAEALRFVTANPALQVGILHRTGTLTAGKDADVALWSAEPLSYAARCEATWVDGRRLFDLASDRAARTRIAAERQRLLGKALDEPPGRRASRGDPRDAYWAAEDLTEGYCCRSHSLEERR